MNYLELKFATTPNKVTNFHAQFYRNAGQFDALKQQARFHRLKRLFYYLLKNLARADKESREVEVDTPRSGETHHAS
jgi:hypothetical protein